MNFPRGLSVALIGAAATIVLVQPQMAQALEPSEISARAKEITVRIDGTNTGSGVIFERTGNTYSVLTNKHVVETKREYHVTAPDGQKYTVPYSQVKDMPDVDLAVLQFTSNQSYQTAELGNSDEMREGNKVYVAGWADPFPSIPEPSYQFLEARITSRLQKSEKGYAIVHDNPAIPGTSSGPVLDSNAHLVAINGRFTSERNTGKAFGLGIPLQIFLAARNNLVVPPREIAPPEGFVSRGQRLANAGDYRGAIAEYNQALESDPNNFEAYYRRGVAYVLLKDFQAAIANFDQMLGLNPNNAGVYFSRGYARGELKDYQAAISDYSYAIRLDPNLAEAYINRGAAYRKVKDYQAAISDYSYAIRLDPDDAEAYNKRGAARSQLGDYQGAISDFNEAIRLNPNLAEAYYNRGNARSDLKDNQGAISDYNEAIRLHPNLADAYYNRGNARFNLKDYQTAISDYNEAIRLNPDLAGAYYNRGNSHLQLGDKQRAIADFQKAADLFNKQARKDLYQDALNRIRELQQ
jgi:tetratricopeptide (TPR) repeat protein